MVRITPGLVGSGSILRRIRMIRRSTARSKASASRALANSSRRSRDSTRFWFAAKTLQTEFGSGQRMLIALVVAQRLRLEIELFGAEPHQLGLARLRCGGLGGCRG